MRPTDILSQEHRVIEQVLDCLEKMAHEAVETGRLEAEPARGALAFFRTFADSCHHGKEETHLFPAMEARGFSPDCGPTAVMRYEHEKGRAHVRGMAENLDAAAAGDAKALDRFARHARGYVTMLREHIQKEDHCLFSMANQALTDEDQQALLARFHRVEAKEMGAGTHETYLEIANELAERYRVARASAPAGCGCGH
jgi:hemerythrin-like domain-containing protein